MSNKLKCACFAALCCVVFTSERVSAQNVANGGDAFSSQGCDAFSSGSLDSGWSPLKLRKIRAKFTEHVSLPPWTPPQPIASAKAGDEFSGYGEVPLRDLEKFFRHEVGKNDPFAPTVISLDDGVMTYGTLTEAANALIVGKAFESEARWDAFFAGRGKRPFPEPRQIAFRPAPSVVAPYADAFSDGRAPWPRVSKRGARVGTVMPIGETGKSAMTGKLAEPRWPDTSLPLKVYISGTVAAAREGLVSHEIKSALRQWREASNGRLYYVLTNQYVDADIVFVCENTTNNQWAENVTEYHLCMYDKVRILLLEDTLFKLDPKRLRAVCLHEVGHAFGIRNHSKDKRDAMSLAATDDFNPIQCLSNNDRMLISKIYP